MARPINIDVSGLGAQFSLTQAQIDDLTELCVQAVTAAVYANWQALAKQGLNSTRPEYLQNLNTSTQRISSVCAVCACWTMIL